MNDDVLKALVEYLTTLGFTSPLLESQLVRKLELNSPQFRLEYKKLYGEELMLFDLHFRRDHQFGGYRLDKYKATHRSPVIIERQTINGIDTAQLEQRMKDIDWAAYFSDQKNLSEHNRQQCLKAMEMLQKLTEGQNFDGAKAQEELMFKYWPAEHYDHFSKPELKHIYEHSREFHAQEIGFVNTNLAYYLVSGRLDELYDRILQTGIEQFPGMDLYSRLEQILSGNPKEFTLTCGRNSPEGYAFVTLPIKNNVEGFVLTNYTVALTPYPPVSHGIYNNIDSLALEISMHQINWYRDCELFIFTDEDEPSFQPRVSELVNQLHQLSNDPKGEDAANLLRLKFWVDATYFEDFLSAAAEQLFGSLPKRTMDFPVTVKVEVAINLLLGRAAAEVQVHPGTATKDSWIRLDQVDADNGYRYVAAGVLSDSELKGILEMLPIRVYGMFSPVEEMKKGMLHKATLNNGRHILLEASPAEGSIIIYTPDKRPIPVNIAFEPDWRPDIQGGYGNKQGLKANRLPRRKKGNTGL